jgi:hypothetical protein
MTSLGAGEDQSHLALQIYLVWNTSLMAEVLNGRNHQLPIKFFNMTVPQYICRGLKCRAPFLLVPDRPESQCYLFRSAYPLFLQMFFLSSGLIIQFTEHRKISREFVPFDISHPTLDCLHIDCLSPQHVLPCYICYEAIPLSSTTPSRAKRRQVFFVIETQLEASCCSSARSAAALNSFLE